MAGSGPTRRWKCTRQCGLGYRLDKLYEVWHWRESSMTLFKSYMDMFFRVKEEASGWPRPDMTTRKKKRLH